MKLQQKRHKTRHSPPSSKPILTNKWYGVEDGINKATFHTLHANRAQLSLAHKVSIILKGRKIVLPEALQNRPAGLPDNTTLYHWRTPATILIGWTIKKHLPHLITPITEDTSIRECDTKAKRTIKQYADRKAYVKPNDLRVGDTVIVKSDNTSKALTPYQPNPMTIIKKKGSMITATHKGSQTTRNSSFFKKSLSQQQTPHLTYWITPHLKMKVTHIRQHHQNLKTTRHNTQL